MAINFNTGNQTLRQLFGNGLGYTVPPFQRDYSWDTDEWDDLWQDIQGTLVPNGEPAHYMGYLVLQTKDNKNFEVIDGQQRLTTVSVLVLALLKLLQDFVEAGAEPENNKRRIDQLRNSYIGYLDPVTLIPRPKLSLNRNDDAYYKDYIVPLQKLPQRGLRASERLLRRSFEWFYQKLRDSYGQRRDGTVLAKFIDDLSDRLFFTIITVTDELNAFKVFETLNARGVRLSPTDLLKNYLFSVVNRESSHAHEIETLERRWEAIVGRLGGESFPDFLRVHWNSRRKFVREADLFKTIRAETPDKAAVFELLRQMEQDVDLYAALFNPEAELWQPNERPYVRELRMFYVRQPWPLFLAAFRTHDRAVFVEILRACSIISFRYNVIGGLGANEQEGVYNGIAQKTTAGELAQPAALIKALAPVYIPDNQFKPAFAEKSLPTTAIRNRRVVRYILFQLEKHLSGKDYDIESERYSLEHILPENPADNWGQFTEEQFEDSVYRLGNMTLLEASRNRGIGNLPFSRKKPIYAASQFEITKNIAVDNDDWNQARLAARQAWMANQATSIWRVTQLS
ncbi:MAG TPA: DUF262 domain-containing protein [Candidatus Angelobacter sp.]